MLLLRSAFFRTFVKLFEQYNDHFIKSGTTSAPANTATAATATTSMYRKIRKSITASTISDIHNSANATDDTSVINFSTHSSSSSLISTTTTATTTTTTSPTSPNSIIDFDYNGYSSGSNHFLNEIIKTQMFHNLINEKIDSGNYY